jgi:Tol biopolymer transport system component
LAERGRPGAPALWIGAALAGVIGALLVFAGARAFGPRVPSPILRRFVVAAPGPSAASGAPPRLSPDGRFLLYTSGNHLVVRDFERLEPIDVAGSEGATGAFWSPDGKRLAFVKNGTLWTSAPAGGEPAAVSATIAPLAIDDGDWGEDGRLVLARPREGLYVLPAAGGEPRRLVQPSSSEVEFRHPRFLPDGRHILAVARRPSGRHAVALISYPEGDRRNLGEFEKLDAACYSPTGHLLLSFEGDPEAIMAVPFSRSSLTIGGPPVLVAAGGRCPSVSNDGSLAYVTRSAGDSASVLVLVQNWARGLERGAGGN